MPIPSYPIPVEIVDLIIDELHADTRTLKNCALVLDYPSHSHEARGLLDVFNEHPSLARSVHHLEIWNYKEGLFDLATKQWTQITDDILPRIFEKLHSLRFFALSACPTMFDFFIHPPEINWSHISPPLIFALTTMLHASPIYAVAIQGFTNIPIADIAIGCPHLTRLKLSCTDTRLTWDADHDDLFDANLEIPTALESRVQSDAVRDRHHLKSLIMDDHSVITIQGLFHSAILPQSRLCLSHLSEIEIRKSIRGMGCLPEKIMSFASGSLRTLSWDCPNYTSYTEQGVAMDAPSIPTYIRSLRLSFDHLHGVTSHHMSYVCTALEEIAKDNAQLEEILLILKVERPSKIDDVWCESAHWTARFDELLTGADTFPHLQHIVILIWHPPSEHSQRAQVELCNEICMRLERMLQQLQAKGILSVLWVVSAFEKGLSGLIIAEEASVRKIEDGGFVI
ncbi:hypothetical protein Hypma_005655 [Hypsizygus marmoreus]|uniref:F-box domain-containing protein n=1 Tax=Hypsizygus marmoreus TaxID=39966 RepID=A0A369JXU2_HYPMA|nr:hypothetical protein Hypma_005655 [Hypsizygus marmoreus]